MRVAIFCHSLVSDWNHGNAHFLRGVVRELQNVGHDVQVFEPRGGWSRSQLEQTAGSAAVDAFHARFPSLSSIEYELTDLNLDEALGQADLVLVHEWNEPELVARIGEHRRTRDYRLLFHDTHHRAATQPEEMSGFDLRHYDGVLAFGDVVRDIYLERGWAPRAWTWHEAADVEVFRPLPDVEPDRDLVWIGNWGDYERGKELDEYLFAPAAALEATGTIYGVRYPVAVVERLHAVGLEYRGWIANHEAPRAFARHRATVHVPRRPYVRNVPGVPTIRVFEALACGIPLVTAPWNDAENLFRPGRDYLVAEDQEAMTTLLKRVINEPDVASTLVSNGLETIHARHTCAHRVQELLAIYGEIT